MKNQKGVTLVALVVTIIVLIILAGISINLILGDNGIITISKKAKENTELAKIEEETELNELYTQLENNGESSGETNYDAIAKLTEFKKEIAKAITEMGVKTSEDADATTMSSNIKSIKNSKTPVNEIKTFTQLSWDSKGGDNKYYPKTLYTATKNGYVIISGNFKATIDYFNDNKWPALSGVYTMVGTNKLETISPNGGSGQIYYYSQINAGEEVIVYADPYTDQNLLFDGFVAFCDSNIYGE